MGRRFGGGGQWRESEREEKEKGFVVGLRKCLMMGFEEY